MNQLPARSNVYLSQLILGSLYESLGEAAEILKTYQPGTNLLLAGPYWLLQSWLNATFEPLIQTHNTINEENKEIKNRKVEGTHLVHLTPNDEGFTSFFSGYVMMFAKRYNFTTFMALFAGRTHGPEWFTREFPAHSTDQEAKSLSIWEAFLTPRLIASRLRPSKNQITLVSYQPNLVSRKFGHIQLMPKSLYDRKNTLCLYNMCFTEDECDKNLSLYAKVAKLTPISFRPSFYFTQEFDIWWKNCYTNEIFDVLALTQPLTDAFTSIKYKRKKGITTYIKEIRAFQKYFEIVYRHDDLSRTIVR